MTQIGPGFLGLLDMPDPLEREAACHLCLRDVPLSAEHVPPQAAFNDQKREWERLDPWQSYRPPHKRKPYLSVIREEFQAGFYVQTLCGGCNNRTGAATANEYVSFVRRLAEAPRLFAPQHGKRLLRVRADTLVLARQIAVMILAIERREFGALHSDLRAFVRGELASVVPPFRVIGFLVPDRPESGTICRAQYRTDTTSAGLAAMAGEISLFPFGVVYAFELETRYRPAEFADITHWFSTTDQADRQNARIETSSAVTVLNSVYCSMGNVRRYPQIDTMISRRN